MQPLIVDLENFLSYGKERVDLSEINLASLLGPNGGGKSSFVDAITYAPYGQGRYKNIDDYVRQGQEQATVELQFLLNGETYRIIRGRSLKGRGKSTLELAKMNGADWIPLSGTTIRETEQKIKDLLRMDYDTFVSSCFILQGQSDRFCAAGPTDRKRILGQILGLDVYDRLQEAAKTRAKEHKEKTAVLQTKIEGLEKELESKGYYEADQQGLEKVLFEVSEQVKNLESSIEAMEKERAELQIKYSNLDNLTERRVSLEREIREIDAFLISVAEKEKDASRKAELEQHLANISAEIKAAESELETAEKKLYMWQADASKKGDMESFISRIAKEIHQFQEQLKSLEIKRNRYQQIIERADQIRGKAREHEKVKAELVEMDHKATMERELQQRLNAAEKAITEWERKHEAKILKLEAQQKEAARKKVILEQVDCNRRDCLFLKDAFEASRLFEQCTNELAKLDALKAPEPLQNAYSEAFEHVRTLGYKPDSHNELRAKAQDLEKWAKLVPELDQAEEQLAEIKVQGRDLQEALKEKQEQKHKAETELTKAEEARVQVAGYESVVIRTNQKISSLREQEQGVHVELGKVHATEEQLKELSKQAETKLQEQKEKDEQIFTLTLEIEDIAGLGSKIVFLDKDISSVKTKLMGAREEEQNCRVELGKLEQRLADLEQKEQEKKALSKDLQQTTREQYLQEQLVKAFGRNGIPALIVENSLPDIEDIANDLLSRLTSGRMSLRLVTQKETKTAGISETLDILIGDELGERPYEGWSGAERFEIDISLRLAISKFLARRAGTKIETLVIDEGASCLDYSGRQKFIEAINTIAEDFAKIICISHIDELKEAFPQQIHVRKTPEGSRVEVVA